MADTVPRLESFQKAAEWLRIGRIAVRKAQEESRRLGVPNVYSFNGKILYELPNGELVRELPAELRKTSVPPCAS
jgi:hypothetical protein